MKWTSSLVGISHSINHALYHYGKFIMEWINFKFYEFIHILLENVRAAALNIFLSFFDLRLHWQSSMVVGLTLNFWGALGRTSYVEGTLPHISPPIIAVTVVVFGVGQSWVHRACSGPARGQGQRGAVRPPPLSTTAGVVWRVSWPRPRRGAAGSIWAAPGEPGTGATCTSSL